MIETETRLRVGRSIAGSEREAAKAVFQTLKRHRGHPEAPPPTLSDTQGGREAMIEVWGEVPEDTDGPGRPPTRKQPGEDWTLVQVMKGKDESGCVESVHKNVVFGAEGADQQFSDSIAQVERTHLTMRHMNGRLVREGLRFSKELPMHEAAAAWEDAVYNLARPLKTLRIDLTGPLTESPAGDGSERLRWRLS